VPFEAAVAVQSPRAIAAALQMTGVEAELGTDAAVAVQSPRAIAAALQITGVEAELGTDAAVAVQSPRAIAAALQITGAVTVEFWATTAPTKAREATAEYLIFAVGW